MNDGKKGTDGVMVKTWLHLVSDFERLYGHDLASRHKNLLLRGDIAGFREAKWPSRSNLPVHLQKCLIQLENLFKRYHFSSDLYTDSQLQDMATEKFVATQERVALPLKLTPITRRVLREARRLAAEVLGEYSEEEHFQNCRFGKRACVGLPRHKSYLDLKLKQALTGSEGHHKWFERYLETDTILTAACAKSKRTVCDTLTLAFAPKSYKAKRTILKNTLIGSFYTYGLGKVIQDRLSGVGLDITSLQVRHGELARKASRDRKLVTADLSSASDSLSRQLLRMILPSKWYHAVVFGIIPFVKIGRRRIRMSSVLTMGMGQTFPLQTLVFYVLLKAIANLEGSKQRFVSVYGDDLIYPRHLHRFVREIFPNIHLILNEDKTYVEDFFRESCGYDYCRGVAVRPHQPEGGRELYSRKGYSSFLYKLYNGLKERWDVSEISETLDFLFQTLYFESDEGVYQVPPSFPDSVGIRTQTVNHGPTWSDVNFRDQAWYFHCLAFPPGFRKVEYQLPYYWEKLRSSHEVGDHSLWDEPSDSLLLMWRYAYRRKGNKKERYLQAGVARKDLLLESSQRRRTNEWV